MGVGHKVEPLVSISDKTDFLSGQLLLVDKPLNWTSFDVVNKIRYALRKRLGIKKIKVGHAGTLDPLATGLLIIAVGQMTKQLESFQNLDKTYEGNMRFGASTPTFDAEMMPDAVFELVDLDFNTVQEKIPLFQGEIEQFPPLFSAVKKNGKAAYKYARKGQKVELSSRKIFVHSFELSLLDWPEVGFKVNCSKGTYIRSLAHDLGKACGNGAYLTRLVRTAIGQFRLEEAWKLEDLIQVLQSTE